MRDFDLLHKSGRFVGGKLLNAKVWRIDPSVFPRRKYAVSDLKIAFVVSTKVSKSAVVRNRAKRQMREVVRLLVKAGNIRHGYLISLMAKGNVLGQPYGEIEKSVVDVLRRGGVLM